MKKLSLYSIFVVVLLVFSACSFENKQQDDPFANIDKVQVITSMGNPMYGADSKVINDSVEIQSFIDTFKSLQIEDKVPEEEIDIAISSVYRFISKGTIVAEYSFNGNNPNVMWKEDAYYYVTYGEGFKTPFELYKLSTAPIIVVDDEGKEIQRPKN